jgi:hypothetical protein
MPVCESKASIQSITYTHEEHGGEPPGSNVAEWRSKISWRMTRCGEAAFFPELFSIGSPTTMLDTAFVNSTPDHGALRSRPCQR